MNTGASLPLPPLLLVGNFLSGWDGRRTYAEDLAGHLRTAGLMVLSSSRIAFRPARLADMALTALGMRGRYRIAIVEVYSGQAFLWAEAATRAAKAVSKKVVLALHGGGLPEFAARHPRRVGRLLRAADAVVAPSAYLRDGLRPFRSDIRLLPNAIDLSAYPFRLRREASARLVWLRAFHRIYDPEMAVRVLAELRRTHPEAVLSMYGVDKDGSLGSARRLAEELGVAQSVRFPGVLPKQRVGEALAEADIFLNTARVDNMPVSVMEAMACGLCVVSTNVGGVPHLVRDGLNGLLVPAGRSTDMTDAVRRLLQDADLRSRLSQGARQWAEQFSWERILPQWLELLESLA
jgi:glycosyltransferase involved in cell wall biosynthesis